MSLSARTLTLAAVVCLLGAPAAPAASAQPDPGPQPDTSVQAVAGAAPPPDGAVPSGPPGTVVTPDGWEITVAGRDEVQVAVTPLTTALSSREYLVAGTFTGSVKGTGSSELSGGTLEVGYQIGCGISLNVVKLNGSVGLTPSLNALGVLDSTRFPVSAQIEVFPQPGEVVTVQVTQKSFTGTDPRVTVKDAHIKIDGCVGQSFLRSYAILTSSTDTADDIVAYYGVPKAV
ncbi:MspA family porin [Mycobacterium sp. SMC-4]|uniref:MspA family porin n=1 Tax=Mycobacterium sp. SMC-4 TaxID=2857059 RepID=UPI003D01F612